MNKFLVVFDANDLETNYDAEEVYADEYSISNSGVLQFTKVVSKVVPKSENMTTTTRLVLHSYAPGFWKKVSLLEVA